MMEVRVGLKALVVINRLMLELNHFAQRCLTSFLLGVLLLEP
jgi:hypothetical protein